MYGLRHFLSEWGGGVQAWTDLPLVPLLHGFAFAAFGEARIVAQLLTALLFAGAVALTCRIGAALWDEDAGFLAGALLLAIPYLLVQVPLLLVDVPTAFFVALAIFASIRAFERGGTARILLASLALSAAVLSKYSAFLLLSAVPAAWAVHRRGGGPRPLRTGALVAAISAALVLAVVLARHAAFSRQVALLWAYQAPGLRRWGESFASTFLFQVNPFVTLAALAGAVVALVRRDARLAVPLTPLVLLIALRVERARYLVPAFPMLALAAAYGLQAIRAREARYAVATCAVASSLVVALYGYRPFLGRDSSANIEEAARYLDSIDEGEVLVLTPSRPDAEMNQAIWVPLLDLFARKKLVHGEEGSAPPPEGAETSALRFTWEYRDPPYYSEVSGGGRRAIAIVADDLARPFPEAVEKRLEGYRLDREFAADDGLHRHRTLIGVYRAAAPASPTGR